MKRLVLTVLSVLIFALAAAAEAAVPPANSPIARAEHPRVFFTAADLPALRDRIAALYPAEFQTFINLLNDTSALSSGQAGIENNWGAFNYAFVAALNPTEMQRRGFTFGAALDTPQEYCARAMSYASTLLPAIAAGQGGGDPESIGKGFPAPIYLPAIAAYDWCFPYLSAANRAAIADAFVSVYSATYKGKNILTMTFPNAGDMVANSRVSADIHDILGILAFYNDSYPSAAIQSEMYDAFYGIWLNRALVELNYFYAQATGWHEGSGGYFNNAYINLGVGFLGISSALGSNYITGTPYFSTYPLFSHANIAPHSLLSQCGTSGTVRCPEYLDRWGTISNGISGIDCKVAILTSGMLRAARHPNAPLAKSVYQQAGGGCPTAVTQYGGTWANAALFWFIYGDREVTAQSPVQFGVAKTQKLGLGQYVMRSGYTSGDSRVVFWAQGHNMYGHATPDYGHFTIHRFGHLILAPANSKSGDAEISSTKFNLMKNVVGIHKGAADDTLDFNGNVVDPFFGSRGISTIATAGRVLAESINNGAFDYVGYDSSPSWNPSTVDVSQREFVYLKGPVNKEYVVVLDRVNTRSPSTDEKVWKIWVPAKPEFVNGTPANPRIGKWTSADTDTIKLTNSFSSLKTPYFESGPTHGRFFLKALLPAGVRVNMLGGPGKEYQSGNDDGSTPWGAPTMTQGMHEYLGWGRVEIRPTVAQSYDLFLNVIQFGDANTLTFMTPTQRVTSTDGKMIGADIRDTAGSHVVLFGSEPAGAGALRSASYTFRPSASSSSHLLVNMAPSIPYYIRTQSVGSDTVVTVDSAAQAGAVVVSSTSQGVLTFVLNGLAVDATVPAAPRNLTLR